MSNFVGLRQVHLWGVSCRWLTCSLRAAAELAEPRVAQTRHKPDFLRVLATHRALVLAQVLIGGATGRSQRRAAQDCGRYMAYVIATGRRT